MRIPRGLRVYISGVHSGPDPSPGLGIALSLREAFPAAEVIAVDYSVRSTGIHHPVFDGVWLQPPWSEIDLDSYAAQVRLALSGQNTFWIPGLDVEIDWMASALSSHPRWLAPAQEAQNYVRKPAPAVAAELGMKCPRWLPALAPPSEVRRFAERVGWPVWVKATYHDASPACGLEEIRREVAKLTAHWPPSHVFLQEHIEGQELAYVFCAAGGRLCGAVAIEKRAITASGKTWGAEVRPVEPGVWVALEKLARKMSWTGGGEIEFVRTGDGDCWLIDFNPRFPAYIYGVTLCGLNLPACLVADVLELPPPRVALSAGQFVRVVQEVAVREGFSMPSLARSHGSLKGAGKHPSHQPALLRRLVRSAPVPKTSRTAPLAADEVSKLVTLASQIGPTPCRVRLSEFVRRSIAEVSDALEQVAGRPQVISAISIKTDPALEILERARERGWWAEAISFQEVLAARSVGFEAGEIVVNGPLARQLLGKLAAPVAVIFADSVETLELLSATGVSRVLGVRLRLPSCESRFGLELGNYSKFRRAIGALRSVVKAQPYGLHFHVSAENLGTKGWADVLEEFLSWAQAVAEALGEEPTMLDFGGGWPWETFRQVFLPSLVALQARLRESFPKLEYVLIEPGKAISARTAVLVTEIVEVRDPCGPGEAEVVVDASIADMPVALSAPEDALMVRDGRACGWLGGGTGRVLGRLCMERDVLLTGVCFPILPTPGDRLILLGAGGYNASMAWHFGNGQSRDGL